MGKPEGKRPLERPRRIWDDNIKIELQEVRTQQTLYIAATRSGLSDSRRPAALWRTPKRQTDRQTLTAARGLSCTNHV